MGFSRNELNKSETDGNKTEVLEIFHYLNSKLPDGCIVNEGHIQIEFRDRSRMTHGFRKKNRIHRNDTKDTMTKEDLLKICHEVQNLTIRLYKGWRFTRIIIRKDDRLYYILEGLARMAKGSKSSWRMDEQNKSRHNEWKPRSNIPPGWKVKTAVVNNISYSASDHIIDDELFENNVTSEKDL